MARSGTIRIISLMLLLSATTSFAVIKKVTLFVNYGEGAILHPGAVDVFKNTLTALKTEKGFELTISEQTNTAAQKAAALANLKSQDVVLFANIGLNSFQSTTDQALIQEYFEGGGKGIGFHASIDHHQYWKWWSDLHSGGTFQGHGSNPFKLNVDPEMKKIPALQRMWDMNALGDPNISQTEIYTLTAYPRGKEGVTMMQVVAPPNNAIPVHDFTWHKKIVKGEYIFTCLGHGTGDFTGGWMQKATWAWMEYLNGKYNDVVPVRGKLRLKPNSVDFDGKNLDVFYAKPYTVKIAGMDGRAVVVESAQGLKSFDLAAVKPGMYFLRITCAGISNTQRLFIK